ncbi:hypothetical protein GCM10023194_24260 [Planotetraspora phitsanulokensis]|uniref:Uncharacterized protein n=1 Tax=Planotetraspora phitsanulokensis TaxID=575192 RepID=A0A8J3XI45_9ACTN|nr:hypothetical protein Pph01_77450 [Planotetraspora phitsanulokensis]
MVHAPVAPPPARRVTTSTPPDPIPRQENPNLSAGHTIQGSVVVPADHVGVRRALEPISDYSARLTRE